MSTTPSSGFPKNLRLVLALAFLSRAIYAIIAAKINGSLAFYRADTLSYILPSESLLHGSFLSSGYYSLRATPEIFRTPGYPLLLLPGVALHHVVVVGLLENFFLVVVSAYLVWKIVMGCVPETDAAFWAALLFCFEPLGFLCSETIMSETAFTAVLLLFLWFLLRYLREPAYMNLAIAALVLGGATFIRPVPLYLSVWLIPVLTVFPRGLGLGRRVLAAILFLTLFSLTLIPWLVRNTVLADYRSFSSSQAWNLYFKAASHTEAKLEHRNSELVEIEWGATDNIQDYFRVHPEQRTWSPGRIARFWSAEANRVLMAHPLTYATIHANGCIKVLFNPGVTEALEGVGSWRRDSLALPSRLDGGFLPATLWLFHEYPSAAVLLPILVFTLLAYYAIGLAGLFRLPVETRVVFCMLFSYVVLVSGHPGVMARYRAPLMPLVCMSGGVAIAYLRTRNAIKVKARGATHSQPI